MRHGRDSFGGGTYIFAFLYLNSFFMTRCEMGRDAQREACHQLPLMFATWHILCYYIGFVFIFSWKVAVAHQSNKTVLLNNKDSILQKKVYKKNIFSSFIGLFFQSLIGRHRFVYMKIKSGEKDQRVWYNVTYTWRDRVEGKLNTNVCGRNPNLNPMERGEKKS